jgi:hypothetical protein
MKLDEYPNLANILSLSLQVPETAVADFLNRVPEERRVAIK